MTTHIQNYKFMALIGGLIAGLVLMVVLVTPGSVFGILEDLKQYGLDTSNVYIDEDGVVQGYTLNYTNAKSAIPEPRNITAAAIILFD